MELQAGQLSSTQCADATVRSQGKEITKPKSCIQFPGYYLFLLSTELTLWLLWVNKEQKKKPTCSHIFLQFNMIRAWKSGAQMHWAEQERYGSKAARSGPTLEREVVQIFLGWQCILIAVLFLNLLQQTWKVQEWQNWSICMENAKGTMTVCLL